MGLFDIFRKNSKNLSNKERMRKIRQSGKYGEDQFRRDKVLSDIERKYHGKDFVEKKTDWTGKTREIPWEVKRNNSPLSPKQMKTRNLHVRRYVDTKYGTEARTEDKYGNRLEHNIFSGKWEKIKKSNPLGFGNSIDYLGTKQKKRKLTFNPIGGSRSSKKSTDRERKSDSIWGFGGSNSLLGSNSNTKKKRTSKKNSDGIFGGGSSDSIWGFGGSNSLLGSNSNTKKKRTSKKNSDGIFGGGSSDSIWGSNYDKKQKRKSNSIW